ncbi:MAG: homocysteine S-methyltransferase family protein [Acidobacteria bacterium]|nr:homocysteine S-methyltransferase family protein [Acidobacteriota bacterium]
MRYNRLSVMDFLEAIRERVWVAEGAMGTLLFSKGIAPGVCLEALNLSNPSLVHQVHDEYRAAGAEIFKSNTFGANLVRLARQNLEDKCREMNIAGVHLAKSVAGNHGLAAGVVGPLSENTSHDARQTFSIQIEALAEGGADFILFETFQGLNELEEAIHAAHDICDLPVVAQVSPDQRGNLDGDIGPEVFVPKLMECGVDAIGCNCGASLASMLDTIRQMTLLTDKPLTAQPSAGFPFLQEGQTVYPCLPAELAEAAGQFSRMGVRIVGGCCGTAPEHIAAIRQAVYRKDANPFPPSAARSAGSGRPLLPYHAKG